MGKSMDAKKEKKKRACEIDKGKKAEKQLKKPLKGIRW